LFASPNERSVDKEIAASTRNQKLKFVGKLSAAAQTIAIGIFISLSPRLRMSDSRRRGQVLAAANHGDAAHVAFKNTSAEAPRIFKTNKKHRGAALGARRTITKMKFAMNLFHVVRVRHSRVNVERARSRGARP